MDQRQPGWQGLPSVAIKPPPSVLTAVKLMYAGAGVTVLNLLATMLSTELATFDIAPHLVVAGMWIWMARMNKLGRRWARALATVICGVVTLSDVVLWTETDFVPIREAPTIVFATAIWLLGLGVTLLLWRRESRVFYSTVN
jgi:hypothetical protein